VYKPSRRVCFRLVVVASFVTVAAYYIWNALDNFHAVIPGQLYRSGQMSAAHLQAHVEKSGIRTIVNLRGANPGEAWYQDEIESAQGGGQVHIDLPIDSVWPTKNELRELMQTLETCPKPVLLHCQSGIDRTGIASALACLLLNDDCTPELALGQLTWQYGCLPGSKSKKNTRDFLLAYEAWLGTQHLTSSRANFHTWLQEQVQTAPVAGKNSP
jgi:protein tyrosine phosphatase (PTP) superfamily phosphohydrolase (DUF442 family)